MAGKATGRPPVAAPSVATSVGLGVAQGRNSESRAAGVPGRVLFRADATGMAESPAGVGLAYRQPVAGRVAERSTRAGPQTVPAGFTLEMWLGRPPGRPPDCALSDCWRPLLHGRVDSKGLGLCVCSTWAQGTASQIRDICPIVCTLYDTHTHICSLVLYGGCHFVPVFVFVFNRKVFFVFKHKMTQKKAVTVMMAMLTSKCLCSQPPWGPGLQNTSIHSLLWSMCGPWQLAPPLPPTSYTGHRRSQTAWVAVGGQPSPLCLLLLIK